MPRGWNDAANLVELVAEEIEPHRIRKVARVHVDGAAARAERARAIKLARVRKPARLKRVNQIIELVDARCLCARHVCKLEASGKRQRRGSLRFRRRQHAQQRPRAGNHHHLAPCLQRMRRLHAARDGGQIRRLLRKRKIGALGKAQHLVFAKVGR